MITEGKFHLQESTRYEEDIVEVTLSSDTFSLTQGDQTVSLTWGQMRSLYLLIESLLRDAGMYTK